MMHARTPSTELHVKFEAHADPYLIRVGLDSSPDYGQGDQRGARNLLLWLRRGARGSGTGLRGRWGMGGWAAPYAATSIVWRPGRRRPAPAHWPKRHGDARAR